jgi:cyclic beta-1,2-glucan synthetase
MTDKNHDPQQATATSTIGNDGPQHRVVRVGTQADDTASEIAAESIPDAPQAPSEPDLPSFSEAEIRASAKNAAVTWDIAHVAEKDDIFSKRVNAAKTTLDQVFAELDSRPIPTYKPGEVLDPLLELRENPRLLRSVLKEIQSLRKRLARLPRTIRPRMDDEPRIVTAADAYLATTGSYWDTQVVETFLDEAQKVDAFTLKELWTFPSAVKFLLLEEILTRATAVIADPASHDAAGAKMLRRRFNSLRDTIYANWMTTVETLAVFDAVLRQDPAGAYASMDFESREAYRTRVSELAMSSDCSELQVAEAVIKLASESSATNRDPNPRVAVRKAHVGYYLIDKGFSALAARIHYRPPFLDRIRIAVLRNAEDFYIGGIEVTAIVLIGLILLPLIPIYPGLFGMILAFVLLVLPVAQGAVDLASNTVTALFKANALPKMDLAKGVPNQFVTLVAVPTLLLKESQVRDLVEELEVRFLANQDANIHFALLTDLPDSVTRPQANDSDPLVVLAVSMIEELNARYAGRGAGSFFLLHRHRIFNAGQGVWMGWERKRGKLLDLNKLLEGAYDSFPVKVGPMDKLLSVKYVITLDSDTQLPRGSAHNLVGAMAHPLNRAIIDPNLRIVTEGYGILQPRVGVSVSSASRSRLAAIYSGQTGFDIYTRAVSDTYQDLFGEGIFTGKGIYEVSTLHAVLDRRFPRNSLLSHDLIEGAYTRAGLATDIEVIDDYPSHYSAYNRRKHRWVRGDWQITQWLFSKVPDESGKYVKNPISAISRWKIFDNLRRSLVEPLTFFLLVSGWLGLAGGPRYWTLVTLFLLFVPSLVQLAFSAGRAIAEPQQGALNEAWIGFTQAFFITFLNLVFLPHQMLLGLDAIIRSLVRRFITGQRLLEWETAAEAESNTRKVTPVDRYLVVTPIVALFVTVLVALFNVHALPFALPILFLWAVEQPVTVWLNAPPREQGLRFDATQDRFMRMLALRTWRFFYQYGGESHNYLVPDNVEEENLFEAARVSPTNFGLLLNARQAAITFGYLTIPEYVRLTLASLKTYGKLEKLKGHIYNWYDTRTLEPIHPITVSSVDSGNLAASFYTLHSGTQKMLRESLFGSSLISGLRDHLALLAEIKTTHAFPAAPKTESVSEWIAWAFAAEKSGPHPLASDKASESAWWLAETNLRIGSITTLVCDYLPWLSPEFAPLHAHSVMQNAVYNADDVMLGNAASISSDIDTRLARITSSTTDNVEIVLAEQLRDLLSRSIPRLKAMLSDIGNIISESYRCVAEMDFSYLIEPSRSMLSIGYMVEQDELHKACYDLLCSEARIGAFVAIAKGEAPQASWFKLGRTHTVAYGRPVLISWTGTMFEYLMPALWMRSYPDTLVTRTLDGVVAIQQAYAKAHGDIPWGISECGYSQKDDSGHYHYQALGIPSIALKWDATAGPVISPYSTFLALGIDASAAMKNLGRMARLGWIGAFGFYEAADYSYDPNDPVGKMRKEPVLVREWMAHHQGMSLLAILNLLHNNIVQEWFHANPDLKATELLLHEKPIRESKLLAEYKEATAGQIYRKAAA